MARYFNDITKHWIKSFVDLVVCIDAIETPIGIIKL